LGTGGLVRAYGDAARTGLGGLKTEEKVIKKLLGIEAPYHFYEQLKRLIKGHNGAIQDETFLADVTVMASFPVEDIPAFTQELSEATAGKVQPIMMDE
jgi:putative IMPACT (imprinted ancient) family translation regulator